MKVRDHLGDIVEYGRIILKWILNNVMMWTGFIWFRWRALAKTVINLPVP
jgi:hypothetical protein